MNSLDSLFLLLASPAATLAASFFTTGILIYKGFHRSADGRIRRRKIATVVLMSATAYIFAVLSIAQLLFGVEVSLLVSEGIGNERLAYLGLAVVADMIFRLWDEFGH